MQEVLLSIPVKSEAPLSPEELAKVIGRLIDLGLADAEATLEDAGNEDDADVAHAQKAAKLSIGEVTVMAKPRVLVVVGEGVADPISDDHVDVEVFDWDNYRDDPKGTGPVPKHFSDLAELCGVPVAD